MNEEDLEVVAVEEAGEEEFTTVEEEEEEEGSRNTNMEEEDMNEEDATIAVFGSIFVPDPKHFEVRRSARIRVHRLA